MANDDQTPVGPNEEFEEANVADFEEPAIGELMDEEEDTPEDVLNSGQYFDDISDDSVRLHLREIGKIPLLSADEELALAQRVVAGDKRAKDKMAEANMRLVVTRDYCGRWRSLILKKGLNLAPMLLGGFVRQLLAQSPIRRERSESQCTWWKRSISYCVLRDA